jgi:hypothetical protein
MQVISKEEARSKGLLYYCTGKPCKRGNVGPRLVSNGACRCNDCREEGRKAVREWYVKHPGKKVEYEKLKYQRLKSFGRSKEKLNKQLERNPNYFKEHYVENKERYKFLSKEHYEKNKDYYFEKSLFRNKRKKESTPSWVKRGDFKDLIDLRNQMRDATGIEWDIDHCIPLNAKKVSGLNCKENLQVIPQFLHKSKGNKMIYSEPYSWLEDFNAVLYCPILTGSTPEMGAIYSNQL